MMYKYSSDEFWEQMAEQFTNRLEMQKLNGRTHDMGLKMYCCYEHRYRLSPKELRDVSATTAIASGPYELSVLDKQYAERYRSNADAIFKSFSAYYLAGLNQEQDFLW